MPKGRSNGGGNRHRGNQGRRSQRRHFRKLRAKPGRGAGGVTAKGKGRGKGVARPPQGR